MQIKQVLESAMSMMDVNMDHRQKQLPDTSVTHHSHVDHATLTAGFLGSSSGMFCSIFPTRSAPTSAALV